MRLRPAAPEDPREVLDAFDETTALRPLHLEPERSVEQDTRPYAV